MPPLKRSYCVAIALAFFVCAVPAKQKSTPKSTKAEQAPGSISGKVFAITEAGDLKPARLANVLLLFSSKISGSKVVDSGDQTPHIIFLKNYTESMEKLRAERFEAYERALKISDEEGTFMSCRWDLIEVDHAIADTLVWAEANKRTDLFPTKTDEEGAFSFKALKQGAYELIVRGQAGMNDAFWEQSVWVHTGEAVRVKVSSVDKSCLKR